jgi:LPS export ABC transporter permease LptG
MILARSIFLEVARSAALGGVLFAFVLFLQKLGSGKLFEILLRGSATPGTVAYLLALVVPPTLPFAVPVGVLVGVLIALGRMSGDGEIVGMRAAGLASRRVVAPVLAVAALGTALTAASSLWLAPLALRETVRVLNRLIADQLTAEVQPRIFEEQFPDTILFVGDVPAGGSTAVRWRSVFMADIRPPERRATGGRELGDQPRVTIAGEAVAVPDVARNRIQLSMSGVFTHEAGADGSKYYSSWSQRGDQVLEARQRAGATVKAYTELDTRPLIAEAAGSLEANIELHRRFALPLACVLLALIGVPLGISSRKAGKSGAFVMTVFLAFLYFMSMVSLIGMAEQKRLPAAVAVWAPNAAFALMAAALMTGLERPGERDPLGGARGRLRDWSAWARARVTFSSGNGNGRLRYRLPLVAQLVDTYVLGLFLLYFGVLLAAFVAMSHVFIFFELLGEIVQRGVPWSRVLTYHLFLTPKLIYDAAPFAVLVGVLVTFGVLSKNNEVTAMKACGVSVYRMAAPVLLASAAFSGLLFAFDHYYVAEANIVQDNILNEIKGRPKQTYLRPDRKWILSRGSRIYYYKFLDPARNVMAGVNVYELNPSTFALLRHISAESARWDPAEKAWIFQNGWVRDFDGVHLKNFRAFQAAGIPGYDEPPGFFLPQLATDKQMNFRQLGRYISELDRSGFDTVRLRVQFHKKFSTPMFAAIMALLAAPFAFLAGHRGAMAGVGVSFGVAIAYWSVSLLFAQIGNLNQLPPAVAAWSPDAVFTLAGMYLFARMRT